MESFILTLPWVLTVAGLLCIIIRSNKQFSTENEYDYMTVEEDGSHQLIRAAIYGDRAFWVHDNVFYESEVITEPDWWTARQIDTMNLSPRSLNNLMGVLDQLKKSESEDQLM